MKWRIGDFVFDSVRKTLVQSGQTGPSAQSTLSDSQARILRLLIEKHDEEYDEKTFLGWAGPIDAYKVVTDLRAKFGGHRGSYISSRPHRLVPRPVSLDQGQSGTQVSTSDGDHGYFIEVPRKADHLVESPMATSERPLPEAVQARIKDLDLPHPVEQALIAALSSDRYPTIMSLSSEMVTNPVWTFVDVEERTQLASAFSPWGPLPPRILYADIFLLRANDELGRPLLFHYFSGKLITGWQAYLFPFRKRQPGERETERHDRNAHDFGRFLGIDPKGIESQSLGTRFVVSVKRDPGHTELAAYVFEFSAILIKESPAWLCQRTPVSPVHGVEQRFRWFHPEELERLDASMRVNADVLRALFHFFGTTFTQVPIGLAEPIVLAE